MSTKQRLQQELVIIKEIKASLRMTGTVIDRGIARKTPQQQIVYASSPITTGKRMYQFFLRHKVDSIEALNKIDPTLYPEKIRKVNLVDGLLFGRTLRKDGYTSVIIPGVFFAEGWTQEHYISLWEQVIIKFADAVHFNKDWQYSDGCVAEFWIALQHNKKLWEGKKMLEPKEGLAKIQKAIEELDKKGISTKNLYNFYRRIALFLTAL